MMIILASNVLGLHEVVDTYDADDVDYWIGDIGGNDMEQEIQWNSSATFNFQKFSLEGSGTANSGTGYLNFSLYSENCSGTYMDSIWHDITNTVTGWHNLTFNNSHSLTKGTKYAICIITDGSLTDDYIQLRSKGTYGALGTYILARRRYNDYGGAWTTIGANDKRPSFKIYNWTDGSASIIKEVNLISPLSGSFSNQLYQEFKFNYTMNETADVCQLWTNQTGVWNITQTSNNPVMNATISLNETILGNYDLIWNIGCNSTNNNMTFATNNYSLELNTLLTFRIKDYKGDLITSGLMTFNNSNNYTSNPIYILATDFVDQSTPEVDLSVTIEDLNGLNKDGEFNITVNLTSKEFNFTLTQKQLILYFNSATQGYVADQNMSYNWTNSTFIVNQQDLVTGYVSVNFGLSDWKNQTQIYEYYNDQDTHIVETLEIIPNTDWYTYYRILDYGGASIQDAVIRVYQSLYTYNNGTAKPYVLTNQRLSDNDGYAFTWGDPTSHTLIEVSKDGYSNTSFLLPIGLENYDKDNPVTIYLSEDTSNTINDNIWVYVNRLFSNRSADIPVGLTAPDFETIEMTTDYRIANGLVVKDFTGTGDDLDRYFFDLDSGTDFSASGTDNITMYIYGDGLLERTITIEYDGSTKVLWFNSFNLDGKILNPILYITLILIAFGIGSMIGDGSASISAFKLGSIALALITSQFIALATIIIASNMIKWGLRKVISE